MSKTKAKKQLWLSGAVAGKNKSHLIAYIGVMTALNVVENAYFSISFGVTQFSLTTFMSILTGIFLGPLYGFISCFVGDFLGYFIGSGSVNSWTPWIGISTAMMALLSGLIFNGVSWQGKGGWICKVCMICLATFFICTVAINTTALYLMWYHKTFDTWWNFLVTRLFLQGQIFNSLANYALLFFALPALAKVKPLKIRLQ